MFHIALHFIAPAFVVLAFYRQNWRRAYLILTATILVDLDHLVASPIYDPMRCSVGFHPLHQLQFAALYVIACLFPKTRLAGIGLCLHMLLDSIDCQFTNGVWFYS